MKLPRFLYTSRPGKGFASYSSPAIEPIPERLKERIRQPLSASNGRNFEAGLGVTRLEYAMVPWMVCTYLQGARDEYSRPFVLSHSALLSVSQYHTQVRHFDASILAPLREGVSADIDENGNIELLESPESSGGLIIREEEGETLNRFTDENVLKRLLICLFAEKSFTLRIKESHNTAISLAVTLLKLAAKQGKTASIATFEPADRTLYMSRVLPDARLRTEFEFSTSGETTDRTAEAVAERVAIDVLSGNYAGIASAFESGNSRAKTGRGAAPRTASAEREVSKPGQGRDLGRPLRRSGAPQSRVGEEGQLEERSKEWRKGWDSDLRAQEENLDKREDDLDRRGDRLNELETTLKNGSAELRLDQKAMEKERTKVAFWKAFSDADEILQREEWEKGFQDDVVELLTKRFEAWEKDIRGRNKEKAENAARVEENQKLMGYFIKLASEHPPLLEKIGKFKDEVKKRKRQ